MNTTTCPVWCTAGSDDYPCDGSHMRLEHESGHPASGSNFPTVDERGAIFPAVSAGLGAVEGEGLGTHLFLWMTGPGFGDGQEVAFTLEEGFGLALDMLEMYSLAIQETERPSAPKGYDDLRPVVEAIEQQFSAATLRWVEGEIEQLKNRLARTDPTTEVEAYNRMFGRLVNFERRRRDMVEPSETGE